MVQPNPFVAEATIRGGVDDNFLGSIREAVQGVNRLGRSTQDLTRDQRTQQNAIRRIERNLRRANEELDRTEEGSDAARRLTRRIGTLNGQLRVAGRNLHEINRELARVGRQESTWDRLTSGVKRFGVAAGIAGGAIAGIGAAARESFQSITELQNIRLDNPNLGLGEARQLRQISIGVGIDEGRLADVFKELDIRVGEFQADGGGTFGELANFGINPDAIASLDSSRARVLALIEAIRGLPAAQQAAAADVGFGGSAGDAARFLANDADAYRQFVEGLNEQPFFTDEQLRQITSGRTALSGLHRSTENLRDAFVIGLGPGITDASNALSGGINSLARWVSETEALDGALGAVVGGVAVVGTGVAGLAGQIGGLGEQTFFAIQGFKAIRGVGPAVASAFTGMAGGVRALAGGIRAATIASLTFLATPLGLAIAGIGIAVVGLTAGIVWLADRVGGFGNLANIAFQSAKLGVLEFADIALTNFRLIAEAADWLTQQISRIPFVNIETDLSSPFDAVREARDRQRVELQGALQRGQAEGRRQDAAGTSLGQRLNPFGRGNEPPVIAPESIPPAASAGGARQGEGYRSVRTGDINLNFPNVTAAEGLLEEDVQRQIADGIGAAVARGAG